MMSSRAAAYLPADDGIAARPAAAMEETALTGWEAQPSALSQSADRAAREAGLTSTRPGLISHRHSIGAASVASGRSGRTDTTALADAEQMKNRRTEDALFSVLYVMAEKANASTSRRPPKRWKRVLSYGFFSLLDWIQVPESSLRVSYPP
eukprot:tig00020557_g11130.t1